MNKVINMAGIKPTTSKFTLNVNDLNSQTKSQRMRWI